MNEQQKEIQTINNNQVIEHREIFSGPIPHPQLLEQYERIVPGAAETIIKMASTQSEHRQYLEKKVISSDVVNSKIGLVFGFVIGMVGILSGVFVILMDHIFSGLLISGATLVSLVGTFVYGSQSRRRERGNRRGEETFDKK